MANLKCPACGGNILREEGRFFTCEYCGTKTPKTDFGIPAPPRTVVDFSGGAQGKNLTRLMERAGLYWDMGDTATARRLYRQVLELDPGNAIAKRKLGL